MSRGIQDGGATGNTQHDGEAGEQVAPLFSIVRGNPDAEELAALTAVVLSLQHDDGEAATAPSRRDQIRRHVRRRNQLAGMPGSWRSGRF